MRGRPSARPPTENPALPPLIPGGCLLPFVNKRGLPDAQAVRASRNEVRRGPLIAVGVAAAARLLPAIFGYEHYGDAPVRIEIAQRWVAEPHLWRGFSETYQYGPLHLTLIGALIRLAGDRVLAARLLSFACGLACVYLLYL